MRDRIKFREFILLLVSALFISVLMVGDALSNYPPSPSFSPPPPNHHDDDDDDSLPELVWISPSGGKFTDPGCPGIEVSFPEDFLKKAVNCHCERTEFQMQLGSGLVDVGQRFFFAIWSVSGLETKFQRPLSFQISYQEQKDGKQIIPEAMEAKLSLCLWDVEKGIWHCLPSDVDEEANYVTATTDTLLPTQNVEGWEGHSLMALLIQISEPTPTRTPTTASAVIPTYTPYPTYTPLPTDTPTPAPTPTPVIIVITATPVSLSSLPPTPTQTLRPLPICGGSLSLGLLLGLSVAMLRSRAG